jgi:Methyltransferase domain
VRAARLHVHDALRENIMSFVGWIKGLVPTPIKESIKESLRRRRFRRAFERYRRQPATSDPPADVVGELVAAWGNQGFSSLNEYIFAFIRHARQTPGPILECGSGLSTLLLGLEAERRGGKVWTLEHHPQWAERMRRELRGAGGASVEFCQAPLRTYGEFAWYDPPLERMPKDFSLVICDGPPGETLGGRYGILPIMKPHLRPGCVILLDDYHRPDEQAAAARWIAESGASLEKFGDEKPYALLRL